MSASQSHTASIPTRITGIFPAPPLACTPEAAPAAPAPVAVRAPASARATAHPARTARARSNRVHPPLPARPQPASSPQESRQMECDKSLSSPDSPRPPRVKKAARSSARLTGQTPAQATDHPASPVTPVTAPQPDRALHAAARPKTDAAVLEQMVSLRRAGKSLRQIGRQTGRCMEGVWQALLRYEQARSETPAHAAQEEDWPELLRDPEPLPAGHPVATQAIWQGLERWRDVV